jgi:hypothetical protein
VPEVSEVTPETIKVRLDWSGVEAGQPQHVNQALASVGAPGPDGVPDGIYLSLGAVLPPPFVDGDEEFRAQLIEKLQASGAKVNIAGSFHLTRRMLNDLIAVLQATAAKYDAAARQVAHDPSGDQGDEP